MPGGSFWEMIWWWDLLIKHTFKEMCHILVQALLNMMASNVITSKKEHIVTDVLRSHIWSASGGRIENTMISLYLSLWLLRNWLSECPSDTEATVETVQFPNKGWSCVTFILLHNYITLHYVTTYAYAHTHIHTYMLQGAVSMVNVYMSGTLILQHE